ncbi:hypothetical protein Tco_0080514 [Tanacetum coccineum]
MKTRPLWQSHGVLLEQGQGSRVKIRAKKHTNGKSRADIKGMESTSKEGGEVLLYCGFGIQSVKVHFSVVKDARALANLAAHGDSNSNNAVIGEEAGAIAALIQVTRSPKVGVRSRVKSLPCQKQYF